MSARRLFSYLALTRAHRPPFRGISSTPKLLRNEENIKKELREVNFERVDDKNKNTYLDMIYIFVNRDKVYRRGHVEFIYSALKSMEEFKVHKDIEVYRALIDVLPKGKFVARNMMQAEFMHYPKQQQCAIDLLQQMEDNGVMPDAQMQQQLLDIFGRRGYPLRKYWRMMYWMPKFKNINPFPVPRDLPNDTLELAKIAIKTMTIDVDPTTTISEYKTSDLKESIDDTWIVSAQSPTQRRLLQRHPIDRPIYVEGAFRVWVRDRQVNYFVLRADAPKIEASLAEKERALYDEDDVTKIKIDYFDLRQAPRHRHVTERGTVHEQEDGTILALCATGSSSKDSLLSWIRHLERCGNAALAKVPVVFTLRSPPKEVATVNAAPDEKDLQI